MKNKDNYEVYKYFSIGFVVASIGVIIAVILFLLTSVI